MAIYNLFDNNINHFYLPRNLREQVDVENDSSMYDFINNSTKLIFQTCETNVFINQLADIHIITDYLRNVSRELALQFYLRFYRMVSQNFNAIKDPIIKSNAIEFIKQTDFTEIFFNLSKLYLENGNLEESIDFLSIADKEYSIHNNVDEGNFLKTLLKEKNVIIWSIIPGIKTAFYNMMNITGDDKVIKEILSFNNTQFEDSCIVEMLCDFSSQMIFQFLRLFKYFYRNTYGISVKEHKTDYQSIKEFRLLGDFCWLYECYLEHLLHNKDNSYLHKGINDAIVQFIQSINEKEISKHFGTESKNMKKYKHGNEMTGIHSLMNKIFKTQITTEERIAYCLFTINVYRNYSAHKLSTEHNLTNDYVLRQRLFLIIMMAFMITHERWK